MLAIASIFPLAAFCQSQKKDDRQQIIDHLHSIFDAFVRQDREKIRATHTEDWTGFQAASREIVRGIDGYMKNVILANKMLEYEIQDIEVKIYGGVAVVFYIAQWKSQMKASGQVVKMRARSVDIYRKETSGWIQCGSNLNLLPTPGAFGTPGCEKCYEVSIEADSKGSR
jgi:ketosteroid isomerase-like protein